MMTMQTSKGKVPTNYNYNYKMLFKETEINKKDIAKKNQQWHKK